MAKQPGEVRDSIMRYLRERPQGATVGEIVGAVSADLGGVSPSSVRSYLAMNADHVFERIGRGRYRLKRRRASA